MGAKTWMLICSSGVPGEILKSNAVLDREATTLLAKKLFSSEKLEPMPDGHLSMTCPPDEELVIGCFPGLTIIAAKEFGIDYPSKLPASFLAPALGNQVYLHAMHSAVDWFAFGVWKNGKLQRSLSLSPDDGIIEDIGNRMEFEDAYWEGRHPAIDPDEEDDVYPFEFHPLELGQAALLELAGYQLEGTFDSSQVQPREIALMRFRRSTFWWQKQIW